MRQAVADKFPSSPLAGRRAGKPGPSQKHRRVTAQVITAFVCPLRFAGRLGHECILWASFAFKVHQIAQQFEMDFHAHVPVSFKEQAIPVMVRKANYPHAALHQ